MKQTDLAQILEDHQLWVYGKGGKRADLRYADLRNTDLSHVDLREADLSYANLSYTNLHGANLGYVDLSYTNLIDVDLSYTNLHGANLHGSNLSGTNLIVLKLPTWVAYVHRETVQIGCQHHSHDDWRQFTDEEINQMHKNALPWWREHKSAIFAAMDVVACKQEKSNE